MRHYLPLLIIGMFALTACGARPGNNPPTATSAIDPNVATPLPGEFNPDPFATQIPPDADAADDPPRNPGIDLTLEALGAPVRPSPDPNATDLPFGGVALGQDLPEPGVVATIGGGDATPVDTDQEADPLAATSGFDVISVFRGGGPIGNGIEGQIFQDGSVLVDGQLTSNVGPVGVNELSALIDEVDVFNITGTFAATIPNPDDYIYVLRVVRGSQSVSIRADDRLMPVSIGQIIDRVIRMAEGDEAPPPPPPAPRSNDS